jgi:hypothetical protein
MWVVLAAAALARARLDLREVQAHREKATTGVLVLLRERQMIAEVAAAAAPVLVGLTQRLQRGAMVVLAHHRQSMERQPLGPLEAAAHHPAAAAVRVARASGAMVVTRVCQQQVEP